mmetsp:Transcript_30188/g.69707  ORF Transcript_30188/g.69707 Transcript_30188/m.69707 type:complete len:217 (-) Transcript_30188:1021-1671(-)
MVRHGNFFVAPRFALQPEVVLTLCDALNLLLHSTDLAVLETQKRQQAKREPECEHDSGKGPHDGVRPPRLGQTLQAEVLAQPWLVVPKHVLARQNQEQSAAYGRVDDREHEEYGGGDEHTPLDEAATFANEWETGKIHERRNDEDDHPRRHDRHEAVVEGEFDQRDAVRTTRQVELEEGDLSEHLLEEGRNLDDIHRVDARHDHEVRRENLHRWQR